MTFASTLTARQRWQRAYSDARYWPKGRPHDEILRWGLWKFFGSAFPPAFPRMFAASPVSVPAAADWWVVAGKTCVAAYQPKDAADLAASYVNLANPGTYDAYIGSAPTFNATTGWTFNGSSNLLRTGVIPTLDGTWSMLVRYVYSSGGDYPSVAGVRQNNTTYPDFVIVVDAGAGGTSNQTIFRNSHVTGYTATPRLASGVAGIGGNKAYWNGLEVGTIVTGSATGTREIYIGAQNELDSANYFFPGTVQAVAIYSDTLTAGEVATVSTAMAGL